jgi:hypothetical protein
MAEFTSSLLSSMYQTGVHISSSHFARVLIYTSTLHLELDADVLAPRSVFE